MDPPHFASQALRAVLEDWTSVRVVLTSGTEPRVAEDKRGGGGGGGDWSFFLSLTEQQEVLSGQTATQHLDHFTCTILSKMCHNVSSCACTCTYAMYYALICLYTIWG